MEIAKEHKELVDRIARENGFTNYEIITSPGSTKGDNFLGVLTAITVKSEEKSLELILKSSHTNEAFRNAAPVKQVYSREVIMYERIFKEFKKFQEENHIADSFDSIPKSYICSTEDNLEGLIMENLKKQEYELWDRKVPMNPGHIKAVLLEYAKFHAISLAMKHKNPKLYEELTELIADSPFETKNSNDEEQKEKFKVLFNANLSNGYKALEDDPVLKEKLKKFESVGAESLLNLKDPQYKLVITHGDCWCNNFMFKYQDPNDKTKPQSLRILDWQLSTWGSPLVDFAYFFLTNSSQEIFDDYQNYIHLYYDKLASQLRSYNLNPDEVFSFSTFENHTTIGFLYGFFLSLIVLRILVTDKDDMPDHVEAIDKGGDSLTLMTYEMKNMDEYTRRLKIILNFLIKNNYL